MTPYIKRFLKNRFCLAFGSATLLDLLFLIPDLIYDKALEDPMIYIGCYLLALGWFLLDIGYALYFRRLIRYQEQLLHTTFNDANGHPLYPHSHIILSDNWLIFAGKSAFCRAYIRRITVSTRPSGRTYVHILKIYATDGKRYTHRFSSRSDAQKIRQWFKSAPPSSP